MKKIVSASEVLAKALGTYPEEMRVVIRYWEEYRRTQKRDPNQIPRAIPASAVRGLKAIGVFVPYDAQNPRARLVCNPFLWGAVQEYKRQEAAKLSTGKRRPSKEANVSVFEGLKLPPMRAKADTKKVDLAEVGAFWDKAVVETYSRAQAAEAAATE